MASRIETVLERSYEQIRQVQAERDRLSGRSPRVEAKERIGQLDFQSKILHATIQALQSGSGR